ncbi:MAG TPA: AMP-binding protein, partial [Methylomirabilota bacterium]|nr:AMP-binding protein [Methylomirabilota bacterium]
MAHLVHHLLRDSAARHPARVAVRFKDQARTYAELDAEADRLAALLAAHGVRRGDRVGIYLHKSLESVASVFGILRAGAAYVPLDPGSPPRRIAFIVQNCAMRALVTTRAKLDGLRAAAPAGLPPTLVLADGAEAGAVAWTPWRGGAVPAPAGDGIDAD